MIAKEIRALYYLCLDRRYFVHDIEAYKYIMASIKDTVLSGDINAQINQLTERAKEMILKDLGKVNEQKE